MASNHTDNAKGNELRQGYLVLSMVLLLVGTSVAIIQYKVPSILEPIMQMYDMGVGEGSMLMSVFTAIGIFLSVPTGALSKRIGPKRVLELACGIVVLGSIIGAFASTSKLLIISRAVEGVAFVFVSVAGPLAVERYVDKGHQGTANGIWSLWICLGSVMGSTFTPAVLDMIGFKGVWLSYTLIACAAAVALAAVVKVPSKGSEESDGESDSNTTLSDYLTLLKPNALLYFFAYLVFNIEILAVLSYTPTFLQSQGMNASLSGFASSLPGLLAIISALVFGKLIDRTGMTKPFYTVALAASGPATFLMLTQSGPLLWVGAALMGLVGYGIPVACLSSLPQIAGKAELMPAAMSVLMLIQCLGEFLGSAITPLLLGPSMSEWVFCGLVMLGLGVAATVAMSVCRVR